MLEANTAALKAGYNYGETTEAHAGPLPRRQGQAASRARYRKITGNEAMAMGLVAAAAPGRHAAGLRQLSDHAGQRHPASAGRAARTSASARFQAEDEIAAIGMAIGAAFGGAMGVTATSGPGICLKSEAIGLAVMTELPLVIIDVQRGGPSTGLPTKTEQADLLQAMFGRNGECPVAIVAPCSPADCFDMAFEAVRIAVALHDAGVPAVRRLHRQRRRAVADSRRRPSCRKITVEHPTGPNSDGNGDAQFLPYQRDERLVRPWAIPGTPGLEHRIGGLEKEDVTGNVSYDPANHEHMVQTPGPEDRQHRQRHSAAGGRRARRRATCW